LKIDALVSDAIVLAELGRRLGKRRVERDLTQAALAREAGVGKRTVERVEAGETVQVTTLLRILRVLGLLESLDAAIPEPGPRPMDLLRLRGKERKRASSGARRGKAGSQWSWGDET
jgi:transcriptional regulator with XRE-family HTH domain